MNIFIIFALLPGALAIGNPTGFGKSQSVSSYTVTYTWNPPADKTADAKKVEKYLQDMLGVNVTEVKMEQSREVGRKKNLMEQIGSQSSDNDSIAAARAKARAAGKAGGSEEGQKFTERL